MADDEIPLLPEAAPLQLTPGAEPKPVPLMEKFEPDTVIVIVAGLEKKLPLPPVAGNVTVPPKGTDMPAAVASPLTIHVSVALVPVPESATLVGELLASLSIMRVPRMKPVLVGAKLTEKLVLCPAANVNGRVRPL